MKKISLFILILYFNNPLSAQILNADRFGGQLDSTTSFKALFDIGFSLQKQVDLLFSLDGKLDLSYFHKSTLFVLVGNFKLFRSGSTNLLNGGFAHARVRVLKKNWIHPEFFGQYQLDGILGMETRILGGGNLRFILTEDKKTHLHFGLGAMYEFERWNYSAIPSTFTITDDTPVLNHYIKLNCYLSYTQKIKDIADFQITAYFQARPDRFVLYPRISFNGKMTFKFTKNIHFAIVYNVYYDALPPVPIAPLYFSFINKLTFSF